MNQQSIYLERTKVSLTLVDRPYPSVMNNGLEWISLHMERYLMDFPRVPHLVLSFSRLHQSYGHKHNTIVIRFMPNSERKEHIDIYNQN